MNVYDVFIYIRVYVYILLKYNSFIWLFLTNL